ncbi:S41 family peptidase [Paenibacillus soyae]|uniref:S41 family peptidase n=1 Tax=Paenibacillus soyae TaxID=2969249 RepID=A0A9X2MW20_9BACL|nr:S41 family peptidase [Paenibacillus soyae]MCR2806881.1 S41 family peptidase [Paenibacillus soyae]
MQGKYALPYVWTLTALLMMAAVLSGCSGIVQSFGEGFREGLHGTEEERRIQALNEAGYTLIEEGSFEEAVVKLEEAVRLVYELHPEYETLEEERDVSGDLDTPFNNLSWAYNELGEFEESLRFIERSLLLLPNTEAEYVNKGNALYGLNRSEEALEQYNLAIEDNRRSESAYYGRGMIYYDEGKFKEAADDFNRYLSFDSSDYDAAEMLLYSLIGQEEAGEALKFADKWFGDYPERFEAYRLKAIALEYAGKEEELEAFGRLAAEKFPDLPEAQELPGELYYDGGNYEASIAYFRDRLEVNPEDRASYVWLIRNFTATEDLASAEALYAEAEPLFLADPELLEAMGDLYGNAWRYVEGARYYGLAAELDPSDEWYAAAKLEALYSGNRMVECAAYGAEKLDPESSFTSIAYYTGLCELERGEYEAAVRMFEHAVGVDPTDYMAYAQLAYASLQLGLDAEAREYADITLGMVENDSTAEYVAQELEDRKRPLGERVEQFFRENYLYQESSSNWDEAFAGISSRSATAEQIALVVDQAKRPDDPFTFVIYGEDYEQLTEGGGEQVTYHEEDDLLYVSIPSFDAETDDRFISILDAVKQPENKTLALDLRGNAGGRSDSANRMLDALLPDYAASTMIYSDGYTESYYSDASSIAFDSIYILVDENSASAAELLALGLKSYLPNVTIVGRQTYGKGVGQVVFEDRSAKIMVFVVNFYWNVKQKNISEEKIRPDIEVEGNALESFMRPVRERSRAG